ncbi:hypothetical protein C8T65DRAFT_749572 [Cerioporus squamosus]|nr:hypothetical protein C8T65DRAFT_749572 [Cerioporus squamosus]
MLCTTSRHLRVLFVWPARRSPGSPLLGHILRAAVNLRHLRVDVDADAVPTVLDALVRVGVIITPTTTLTACRTTAHGEVLPRLRSVRSSRLPIIEALMRYRSIDTAIVDSTPQDATLAKFFRSTPPWDPCGLRRVGLNYCGYSDFDLVLRGLFTAFPCVEHCELRITGSVGLVLLKEAIQVLGNHPSIAPRLAILAVNHAVSYGYTITKRLLGTLGAQVRDTCSGRVALRLLILCDKMYCRDSEDEVWVLKESTAVEEWSWFHNKDQGDCAAAWEK